MTYAEKLKDPRWQKKRLKILERDGFMCTVCEGTKKTLHVHHVGYGGNNPWDTDDDLLTTMCEDCHEDEEDMLFQIKKNLVNDLRNCGLSSTMMAHIPSIFKDTNRGWLSYEPAMTIIKYAVDNTAIWDQLERFYIQSQHHKQEKNKI